MRNYENYDKNQVRDITKREIINFLLILGVGAIIGLSNECSRKLGFREGMRGMDLKLREVGLFEEFNRRCDEGI